MKLEWDRIRDIGFYTSTFNFPFIHGEFESVILSRRLAKFMCFNFSKFGGFWKVSDNFYINIKYFENRKPPHDYTIYAVNPYNRLHIQVKRKD